MFSPEGFHLLLQLCILCLGDAQLLRQVGAALLQPAVVAPARQLLFQLLQHSGTVHGCGQMASKFGMRGFSRALE